MLMLEILFLQVAASHPLSVNSDFSLTGFLFSHNVVDFGLIQSLA